MSNATPLARDRGAAHVTAVFSAEHVQSLALQKPSRDSDEHAMYGCEVAYEIPVPVFFEIEWIHWYGPSTEPPWHEPALPQLSMCCTESWMSGNPTLPLRSILIRSASADVVPCAQHEPQYCGMCWLSDGVQ